VVVTGGVVVDEFMVVVEEFVVAEFVLLCR